MSYEATRAHTAKTVGDAGMKVETSPNDDLSAQPTDHTQTPIRRIVPLTLGNHIGCVVHTNSNDDGVRAVYGSDDHIRSGKTGLSSWAMGFADMLKAGRYGDR